MFCLVEEKELKGNEILFTKKKKNHLYYFAHVDKIKRREILSLISAYEKCKFHFYPILHNLGGNKIEEINGIKFLPLLYFLPVNKRNQSFHFISYLVICPSKHKNLMYKHVKITLKKDFMSGPGK